MKAKAIIAAGGKGSRMKRINDIPKVFQLLHDKPMIEIIIGKLIESGFKEEDIILVLSPETLSYALEHLSFKKIQISIQKVTNGSGGAIKSCIDLIKGDEWVLMMSGDGPLFNVNTIKKMIKNNRPCLSVTALDDPLGFGRVILKDDKIVDIVEESDCTKEQSLIKIVNTSIFYVKGNELRVALSKLDTNNKQKEYYLTYIVQTYPLYPHYLEHSVEGYNVNTPENLGEAKIFYLNAPEPPSKHISLYKKDKRIIVVSDIHGCYKTFMKLLDTVKYDESNDILISVGDIIMKGPDSQSVIDWFRFHQNNVYCIRGNNEERHLGLRDSLFSNEQLSYMESLPYTITIVDIDAIIVHAGLINDVKLQEQKVYDMITMRNSTRDKFNNLCGSHYSNIGNPWYNYWTGSFVIYGHDAVRGLTKSSNAYGIDTGCCYGKQLTACIINTSDVCNHDSIETISIDNCE